MDNNERTLYDFMALPPERQGSEEILSRIDSTDLISLLVESRVLHSVKKSIASHLLTTRIDDNENESDQSNAKYTPVKDFKAMQIRDQTSEEVLSTIRTRDLISMLVDVTLQTEITDAIYENLMARIYSAEDEHLPERFIDESPLIGEREYPALKFIASMLKLFGWVLIIVGIIAVGIFISKDIAFMGILILAVSILFALLSFASAELILVITDISSSAFKILMHLKGDK